MSSTPAPGWYPDPEIPGHIRYWDGAAWMAGTSQPAQQAPAGTEAQADASAQDAKMQHDGKLVIPGEVVAARSVPLSGPQGQQPQQPQGPPPGVHDASTREREGGWPAGGFPQQAGGFHDVPTEEAPGGAFGGLYGQPADAAGGMSAGQQPGPAAWRPPSSPLFEAVERRPAAFGRRMMARIADLLVPLAAGAAVAALTVPSAIDHIHHKIDAVRYAGQNRTVWLVDATTLRAFGLIAAAFVVATLLYEALPTWRWGRSLGKTLFGLRVVDIESHDTPRLGQSIRRWLVFGLLGPLVVGFLAALWGLFDRPWRQGWHDKAARTFVARDS